MSDSQLPSLERACRHADYQRTKVVVAPRSIYMGLEEAALLIQVEPVGLDADATTIAIPFPQQPLLDLKGQVDAVLWAVRVEVEIDVGGVQWCGQGLAVGLIIDCFAPFAELCRCHDPLHPLDIAWLQRKSRNLVLLFKQVNHTMSFRRTVPNTYKSTIIWSHLGVDRPESDRVHRMLRIDVVL